MNRISFLNRGYAFKGLLAVKIVVSMATDRSHRLTMGKTKKIFFSETTRPTALIFGM